jgi:hypothetical protein
MISREAIGRAKATGNMAIHQSMNKGSEKKAEGPGGLSLYDCRRPSA